MKLPNAGAAIVDERKVHHYLLNPGHPDNGGKAAFFEALGFTRSAPGLLVDALRHSADGDVVRKSTSPHGDKYVVDAILTTPTGQTREVRTVWIVDGGTTAPRLVTAYPRG